MFEARIENVKNDILTLTGNETEYQVMSITGLNPPKAQINNSTVTGLDGAKYNSSRLEVRNIVITLKINGDVETNRQNLYKYCPTKEWCKFYYKNNNRNVYIEGYVENVECDLFTDSEIAQISLICEQPYFKAMNEIIDDISKVISLFEFPFTINYEEPIPFSEIQLDKITNIYNNSESETGVIIVINFINNVNKIEIRNTVTGEYFILNYVFLEDDKISINTNKGEKSIKLLRNGITYNLFTAIQKGSTFFRLSIGDNLFSYEADDGSSDTSVDIVFKHRNIYRGV